MDLAELLDFPPTAQISLAAAEARAGQYKSTISRAHALISELAGLQMRSEAVLQELGRLVIRRETFPEPTVCAEPPCNQTRRRHTDSYTCFLAC